MSFKKRRFLFAAIAAAVCVTLLLFHSQILNAAGQNLIQASPPVEADAVFVLAGDGSGNRILKAAELVRDGFAPVVIVSGPAGFYGMFECDAAIPFAVDQGFPEESFAHFEHHAHSTEEEAAFAADEIQRLGIHRLLLVTSNYHTRRAMIQFRRALPGIELTMVAAPDVAFSPDGWWKNREGQKVFFYEWSKTVATWFGI